jgi:hypothetical protein
MPHLCKTYDPTPPENAKIILIAIITARKDQIHLMAVFVFLWKRKLMVMYNIPHVRLS